MDMFLRVVEKECFETTTTAHVDEKKMLGIKKETLKYHIRAGYWSHSKARQSEVYILGLQPATVDP